MGNREEIALAAHGVEVVDLTRLGRHLIADVMLAFVLALTGTQLIMKQD